ncbi:hypothetical protein [Caudoviricetes sp.]|nr:hypothetical protein [Caudoviricetes sp.]
MSTMTEKSFNVSLKIIRNMGDKFAQSVHEAGMFALQQANLHNNNGFAVRLMEAVGKKHDAKRLEKWLCHFGKLGIKQGILVYRNRKDIVAETVDATLAAAEATPYWELTQQEHHKMTFDTLAALKSLIARHDTVQKAGVEGKPVEIKHEAEFAAVKALFEKLSGTAATGKQVPVAG